MRISGRGAGVCLLRARFVRASGSSGGPGGPEAEVRMRLIVGAPNQHGGGGFVAYDEEIMGWLFGH